MVDHIALEILAAANLKSKDHMDGPTDTNLDGGDIPMAIAMDGQAHAAGITTIQHQAPGRTIAHQD